MVWGHATYDQGWVGIKFSLQIPWMGLTEPWAISTSLEVSTEEKLVYLGTSKGVIWTVALESIKWEKD